MILEGLVVGAVATVIGVATSLVRRKKHAAAAAKQNAAQANPPAQPAPAGGQQAAAQPAAPQAAGAAQNPPAAAQPPAPAGGILTSMTSVGKSILPYLIAAIGLAGLWYAIREMMPQTYDAIWDNRALLVALVAVPIGIALLIKFGGTAGKIISGVAAAVVLVAVLANGTTLWSGIEKDFGVDSTTRVTVAPAVLVCGKEDVSVISQGRMRMAMRSRCPPPFIERSVSGGPMEIWVNGVRRSDWHPDDRNYKDWGPVMDVVEMRAKAPGSVIRVTFDWKSPIR